MGSSYTGIVEKGAGRGGALGFPTINIPLSDPNLSGTYAGRVRAGGASYPAALYADTRRKIFEAHLIEFSDDLYGKTVTIEILEKIRGDMQFANDEIARAAIAEDVRRVKEYFKKLPQS